MKNYLKSGLLAGIALVVASACTLYPAYRYEVAQRLASPAHMIERVIYADPFALTAYERIHQRFDVAHVYIEGDGLAWLKKSRPSEDPTPQNPVALHLATRDKANNVIYLARPCQYTGLLDSETPCDSAYWTNKRFAPEVIAAYHTALEDIKRRWDIRGFHLTGFSGGAAVAALLAAQRDDVHTLRTVAGNLDHREHSHHHNVSTLDGSLNPPEFSDRLSRVPQYHFIGGQDDVVPPAILHSYVQKLGATNCLSYEFIQEAAHQEGWVEKWPELLAKRPVCHGPVLAPEVYYDPPEPIRVTREVGKGK